jgi:HD-GYP domain-containing protein (c-di-GMP phosphodiesterase class II)
VNKAKETDLYQIKLFHFHLGSMCFLREPLMVEAHISHLEPPYLQFVETMAQALDARDPYTAGHSYRVAEYSYATAVGLGLSETQARTIHIAAQLHDIGKIGMSDAVLQKKGRLTREEFAFIKQHPQIGRKILERVDVFDKYLSVVELHHENADGSGYPYGIRGTQIPLEARIVRIADAFDAMTSDRSYRPRLTQEMAEKEIFDCSGTHFDREVATVFLNLAAAGRIQVIGNFPPALSSPFAPRDNDSQYLLTLQQVLSQKDAVYVPETAVRVYKNN